MNIEQTRVDTNGREHSNDHQYTLAIEETAELYAKAGLPRTARAIQKYCAVGKLDCHKVETETGEKYLVAPYSIDRHIAYIKEVVRTDAINRDQSRPDATSESKAELPGTRSENDSEQSRPDAKVRSDEKYLGLLERENTFLRGQIEVKDGQIKELTERARETNVLIAGLQKMIGPMLRAPSTGDN
jgi:hypothetical protein